LFCVFFCWFFFWLGISYVIKILFTWKEFFIKGFTVLSLIPQLVFFSVWLFIFKLFQLFRLTSDRLEVLTTGPTSWTWPLAQLWIWPLAQPSWTCPLAHPWSCSILCEPSKPSELVLVHFLRLTLSWIILIKHWFVLSVA